MRRYLPLAAKLTVTAAVFYLIASKLHSGQILALLRTVPLDVVLGAVALLVVQTLVTARRWVLVMSGVDVNLELGPALRAVFVSLALNQCLPSYVGGDTYRVLWARRKGGSLGACTRGVLIDRVSAVMALVLMLALFMPRLFGRYPSAEIRTALVLLLVAGTTASVAFLTCDLLPHRVRVHRFVDQIALMSQQARAILLSGSSAANIAALTLGIHLISSVIMFIFARSLAMNVRFADCIMLTPVVMLLTAIPISVAGWGVREGVFIGALGFFGIEPEPAVTLSLLFGFTTLAGGLLGVVPMLLERDSLVFAGHLAEPSSANGSD